MFSYQRNFFEETQVVTPELFNSLFDDPQYAARWKVLKRREVLKEGCTERWLATEEYQEWARRMATDASKDGKAFRQAPDDRQRVVLWCEWLKKTLPAVMFMAWFDETVSAKGNKGRWRKKVATNLSGLVVLDIDHLKEDPRTVFDSWTEEQRRDIVFCMKSPGGEGLKVVFKAHREWGNLADNIIEKSLQLGLQPDFSGIDSTRPCFVSLREDIYFINEEELFTYEDKEFAEEWNPVYRQGGTVYPAYHDKDDGHWTGPANVPHAERADAGGAGNGAAVPTVEGESVATGVQNRVKTTQKEPSHLCSFDGWTGTVEELMAEVYRETGEPGSQPEGTPRMSRHGESLKRAYDLLVMTGRNKKLVEQMLKSLPWVDAIVKERGEDVAETVSSADARLKEAEKKYATPKPSKAVQEAVKRLKGECTTGSVPVCNSDEEEAKLPLEAWGKEIEELFDYYPCLREVCSEVREPAYPVILFASAAFFGTLMTRTWYHYWFSPDVVRRLNYCVIVIGDPGTGKSIIDWIYKLLAAPLIAADKVGNDATNRYKKEVKLRTTSSKEQKKEGLKMPEPIIRCHGSRTANGVFIEDMVRAVDTVDGEPMHLHLLTFDTELENATLSSKGGQWIDKSIFELKAFHNETDDQQYRNVDSVNGPFDVFWNFVYTGTPLSLKRKVNERNFGSGLSTRLAVIPMPSTNFKMPELVQKPRTDHARQDLLKTWAFRLDDVSGELPVWPLCEEIYDWQKYHTEIAAYNEDKADEMLLKRVGYYGINISMPFILMRHWDEWKEKKTFEVDDIDKRLCRLVLDIQYYSQRYFFGRLAELYFENQKRDIQERRQRQSKYDQCYEKLPQEFTSKEAEQVYGIDKSLVDTALSRLCKRGYIERLVKGRYRKIRASLM